MADALRKDVLDSAVNPSSVARQKFDLERRGFDQAQVRAYLIAVADALRDAQERESEIRSRLGKAIRRAEKAEAAARDRQPAEDPSELTRQLGDEVAAVLDAARVAGEQKIAAAEKSAAELLANAKTEANEIRRAAESIMDVRRAEADAVADKLLAERQAEADKLVATARRDAELLRSDAAADVARVRDECDNLIREAEEARTQILQDMDRRRRQARAQVERLRVGRDRLLRSYEVVRRTLDESTVELKGSLREAKVLGDTAARKVAGEALSSPEQLEAEMIEARLIGRARKPEPAGAHPERPATKAEVQVPRVDLRTASFTDESAPTPKRPVVMPSPVPKPPSIAPQIKAPADGSDPDVAQDTADTTETTPAHEDASADAAASDTTTTDTVAETQAVIDTADQAEDFSDLPKEELRPIEASDEIESVVALVSDTEEPAEGQVITWVPTEAEATPGAEPAPTGLFAALRAQASRAEVSAEEPAPRAPAPTKADRAAARAVDKRRQAIISAVANDVEKRLKRALADEQNEVLAGIRAAGRNRRSGPVELISLVGEPDDHVRRYVVALSEVAAQAYEAGAALVDGEPNPGEMPAGAVEELLGSAVVLPLRLRLIELDALEVESASVHVDALRAFYRQRKTDHLGEAATSIATLLVNAGACDCLPEDTPIPWLVGAGRH